MMTEPTIEEVRKALAITERSQFELIDVGEFTKALDVVMAAARLWVDAGQPNIEAVSENLPEPERQHECWATRRIADIHLLLGDNNVIRRAE